MAAHNWNNNNNTDDADKGRPQRIQITENLTFDPLDGTSPRSEPLRSSSPSRPSSGHQRPSPSDGSHPQTDGGQIPSSYCTFPTSDPLNPFQSAATAANSGLDPITMVRSSGGGDHGPLEDQTACDRRLSGLAAASTHPPNWHLYRGIIYSSLSSLFFSLSAVIVKLLRDIHPGELAVFRFLGILALSAPLVTLHGQNPCGPAGLRHYLILRGLAGATSLFLRFVAFRHLPLADASVIIFSVPIFVTIFARLFLREPCGTFQTGIVALTMLGLCMTTRLVSLGGADDPLTRPPLPPTLNATLNLTSESGLELISPDGTTMAMAEAADDLTPLQQHLLGVTAALSSTLFGAAVYIVIRRAKAAHHSVIMFNFGWVALLETTLLTTVLDGWRAPRGPFEWSLVFLLGLMSFAGQWLLTRSLQLEEAGPVSVVRAAADILLAFVWQIWIFGDMPDFWSAAGALLVTVSILASSLRKWLLTLPLEHPTREKFHYLTL